MIKVGLGGVLEVCGECYNIGKLIGLLFLFCLPLLSILSPPPLYFVFEN